MGLDLAAAVMNRETETALVFVELVRARVARLALAVWVASVAGVAGCAHHTYGVPVVVVTPQGDVAWVVEDDGRIVRCVESSGNGPRCLRADVGN